MTETTATQATQSPIAPQSPARSRATQVTTVPTPPTPAIFEEDLQVCIVYSPRIENRSNPLGLSCPKHPNVTFDPDKRFLGQALELDSLWLHQGSQLISKQLWEKIKAHPPMGAEISRLERKGVIRVIQSSPNNFVTQTTLDFEVDDALEMVANSWDVEWLRLCITKDNRPEIYKTCVERIKEVEEAKRPKQ